MARAVDDASSQYLHIASTPITAAPLSMSCWFNTDDTGADQGLVMLEMDSSNYFFLMYDASGELRAYTEAQGTSDHADSTAGPSVDTWHHGCAVYSASDSRAAFLDGANKGVETTDLTPTSPTDIFIGTYRDSAYYFSGRIAEVALWEAGLVDAEVAALAAGYSPLLVRPGKLLSYWSMIRDEDQDLVGGYDLTPQNSPTVGTHVPVFGRAPLFVPVAAAGAPPAGDALPMAMDYYRRRRA